MLEWGTPSGWGGGPSLPPPKLLQGPLRHVGPFPATEAPDQTLPDPKWGPSTTQRLLSPCSAGSSILIPFSPKELGKQLQGLLRARK